MSRKNRIEATLPTQTVPMDEIPETRTIAVTHADIHRMNLQEAALGLREAIEITHQFGKSLNILSKTVDKVLLSEIDMECEEVEELINLAKDISDEVTLPMLELKSEIESGIAQFKEAYRSVMN